MADSFPVSGNIEATSFPHLLVDLHRQGATGSLKVNGPLHPKALYFRSGRILFGSSNDPRDQLGAILIESGKITREQLDEVNEKVGPGNPLAKVLAESGFVNQRELGDAARTKVERILSDVLSWATGNFEFEDGVLPKGAVDLKLSTSKLLLAAVQRIGDRDFVLRHLGGDMTSVLEALPDAEETLTDVKADVWPLLERLDGERTLQDAVALTRIEEFEAAKVACALLFLGIVKRKDQGGGSELDLAEQALSGFGDEASGAPAAPPDDDGAATVIVPSETSFSTLDGGAEGKTEINFPSPDAPGGAEPLGVGPDEPVGVASEEPLGIAPEEPLGVVPDEPVGVAPEAEPVGVAPEAEALGVAPEEPVGVAPEEPVGVAPEEPPIPPEGEPTGFSFSEETPAIPPAPEESPLAPTVVLPSEDVPEAAPMPEAEPAGFAMEPPAEEPAPLFSTEPPPPVEPPIPAPEPLSDNVAEIPIPSFATDVPQRQGVDTVPGDRETVDAEPAPGPEIPVAEPAPEVAPIPPPPPEPSDTAPPPEGAPAPPSPDSSAGPTQEDLAALDELLNPSGEAADGAAVDRPKPERWEPQFRTGPSSTLGPNATTRRAVGRKSQPSRAPLFAVLAGIVVIGLGAGYYFLGMSPGTEPADPAPTAEPTPALSAPVTVAAQPTPVATPDITPTPDPTGAEPTADPLGPAPTPPAPTAPTPTPPPAATPTPTPPPPPPAAAAGDGLALLRQGSFDEAAQAFASSLASTGPDTYSIQVLAACSPDTIRKAAENVGGDEIFILPVNLNGRSCYRVGWGVYDSKAAAEAGAVDLPPYFRQSGITPRIQPLVELLP